MRGLNIKIQNMVAAANFGVDLDLYAIAREVDNVEYEPEQFPGAILKLKEPKTSLLLFKNGKIICAGAKSEEEIEKAIKKAYSLVKPTIRIKKKPKLEYKVVNIVSSANFGVDLDLYAIAREVDNVEYEPEQFPGAILKLKEPKTSLLLFKNGKIICTGATSEKELRKAVKKTYELVKDYARKE